jgi:multidrug efflux pump subunit AcrA (membrane-fusion protein)
MSGTAGTPGQDVLQQQGTTPAEQPRVPGHRYRWVAAGVVVLVVAGAAAGAWAAGVFRTHSSPGTGSGLSAPATASVVQEDLSSQTPVTATLGYAATYTVRAQGSGTLTWLPSTGQVIGEGQALYRVGDGVPVALLYGSVPDWRDMSEGTTGSDVTQLNHDLVRLGYAHSSDISTLGWDYYSWETFDAVQKLEEHLGVTDPSGSLTLGSVVFEPEALRITGTPGALGSPASGPVLTGTSDRHVVTVNLNTSQENQVRAGDSVTVTMPDGSSTPGVITAVGTVASGSGTSATIPVYVRLTHAGAAGNLDQAPVTVDITTAAAHNVLVVPVGALLAQPSGGYAVEVLGAGNSRHLVPVTVGIFDDTNGTVQVTGALTPGERVVVPSA